LGRSTSPPPAGAACTRIRPRVAFYETDAMAIVHHANYVRFLELVRVVWMDEHDRPYREYAAEGLHFATTRVEIDYRRSASFDDAIDITAWMEWVRGASLGMAYQIHRGDDLVATAATEHAMVDLEGRPRRIPPDRRKVLLQRVASS
jgi:acyl-CoA thioester hydrolase